MPIRSRTVGRVLVVGALLASGAALIGARSLAGANASESTPAAPVAATSAEELSFTLDPLHCMALFRIHHAGAGQFWGRFNDVRGTMKTTEDASGVPSFDITIPVKGIDSGVAKLDRTLMGPDFFNEKDFGTITYRSTGGEPTGERAWKMTGELTLLGTTKDVVANVEMTGIVGNPVQKKAGFEAILTIKRSDFGMDWGVSNNALGDEVRLVVGLEGDWSP